jgi:hypothetical protein
MGLRLRQQPLCWRFGDGFDHRSAAMEIRQYIRPDVTASAIAHLSLLALVIIYTEIRPFAPLPEEAVPVDVVVADEPEKKTDSAPTPTPTPQPSPDLSLLSKPASLRASSAAAPPSSGAQPKAGASASRGEAAAQPQPEVQATSAPAAASSGYIAAQPDITVKYHVMLGLPEDIPMSASASSGDKRGEGGDTTPAADNLASNVVETLRRHLKTCSKLPASLSPSDNVAVKLRVQMMPDGRLAAEPALIEGTASVKGVQLMQSAIAALAACQPYAMLPADRYGEWKVLELSFTPHDFTS